MKTPGSHSKRPAPGGTQLPQGEGLLLTAVSSLAWGDCGFHQGIPLQGAESAAEGEEFCLQIQRAISSQGPLGLLVESGAHTHSNMG